MNIILALIAIWVALDIAVLVALNRWRDGIESGVEAVRSVPPPFARDECVGWIERRGFVRMRRREP